MTGTVGYTPDRTFPIESDLDAWYGDLAAAGTGPVLAVC